MRKTLLIIFAISLLSCFVKAQTNIDTPNLSFDDGSLNGWKLYFGDYYYDIASASYTYNWTQKTPAQANNRIKVIGNLSGTNDPIVACSGFYTNPYDKLVARIGEPLKPEGNGSKNAAAEKIEYTFKVTSNTTLLSYKLAAVLKVPPGDNHLGEQRPTYDMNISVTDDNGVSYTLPCSSYSTKADNGNASLTPNAPICLGSIATKPGDYSYQKWISGNIDLSKQIGKTVTISIVTHDCLVSSNGNIIGGSHDAYGYFWAETKKIELTSFSCENSDATISAPVGFGSYNWTRSNGMPVTVPNPSQPWIASIEKAMNLDGVIYSCTMDDANSACGAITVSSTITPVKLHPGFTSVAIDAGKIQFTSNSTAEGDSITDYYWDFGDGVGYSNLKNPIYTYSDFKPFNVKLTVTSSKGCSKTFNMNVLPTKELIAAIFPPANLGYNGQTKDFTATTNIAGLQMNIDYYIRYTNRPGTAPYTSYTAPSNAGDYTATFELSYLSLLKYFMNSVPTQDFSIIKAPLVVTANNVTKTYGEKITLLREAFTQDMKPLYAGDKIYELELKCGGLSDTASVGNYIIKADSAIGLGVKNYDILFVDGTLTVNPKALNICSN
ncbi:MAG: PKD domain-containing protein [Paludibacter sp.]